MNCTSAAADTWGDSGTLNAESCCQLMFKKPWRCKTGQWGPSVSPGQIKPGKRGRKGEGKGRGRGRLSSSPPLSSSGLCPRTAYPCSLRDTHSSSRSDLGHPPFRSGSPPLWSHMADAMQHNSTLLPLLELPAPCLRSVCLALWSHPKDLAALSVVCTATRTLVDDTQLWKEVLLRRYGRTALPGEAPAGGAAGEARFCGTVPLHVQSAATALSAVHKGSLAGRQEGACLCYDRATLCPLPPRTPPPHTHTSAPALPSQVLQPTSLCTCRAGCSVPDWMRQATQTKQQSAPGTRCSSWQTHAAGKVGVHKNWV